MVHEDYKELIPAHALSSLDADDERALNEHLAQCAECRRDLAEWEATGASLALSAKPMEPSPQVREKLLTEIRAEKSASDSAAAKSVSEESASEGFASNVVPFSRPPRTLWNSLGSVGSIAAVVLFAALIVSVFVLWQQNRALRQENQLFELITSPDSRVAELYGTAEASGASAKLLYDNSGRAFLVTAGLPSAAQGKEYQFWYIVDNKPIPSKTFVPDSQGQRTLEVTVPDFARKEGVVAVTLEPAGGVPAPTGAIYLRGKL